MAQNSVERDRETTAGPLAALYQSYFDQLVAGLRATYGGGPPDPSDIAQRTFEKLSARGGLNGIDDPEGYTWIVARNLMMTELRSQSVRARHATDAQSSHPVAACDELDPERVLIAKDDLEVVMSTLREMPERRRNIFLAKRVEGMTAEAAGAKFGVSRTAAIRHIAIATAAISEALGHGPRGGEEGW
ncbi:MAG: sigma-70 family RNA polymerase sigma factor [Pseudomonadota bacterium]